MWPVCYLPLLYQSKLKVEESEMRTNKQKVSILSRNSCPPCYGTWVQHGGVIRYGLRSFCVVQLHTVSLWSLGQKTGLHHPHLTEKTNQKQVLLEELEKTWAEIINTLMLTTDTSEYITGSICSEILGDKGRKNRCSVKSFMTEYKYFLSVKQL